MSADRGRLPRYAQIAALIRGQIIDGRLGGPGTRIPSEPELIDDYGVSKTTASAALAMLAEEGLIVRRSGSGSFVFDTVPSLQVIAAPPGSRISARPARIGEFAASPASVTAIVLERPGLAEAYPADRTVITVSP